MVYILFEEWPSDYGCGTDQQFIAITQDREIADLWEEVGGTVEEVKFDEFMQDGRSKFMKALKHLKQSKGATT